MIVVEMISKAECRLCDIAWDALLRVQQSFPFELRLTKIAEGDRLFEEYKEKVPAVLVNGEMMFQYKVKESELLAKLRAIGN